VRIGELEVLAGADGGLTLEWGGRMLGLAESA